MNEPITPRVKPHKLPSPCCRVTQLRDETHDAYYCSACRVWLEPQCSCRPEDKCPYSVDAVGVRPERAP